MAKGGGGDGDGDGDGDGGRGVKMQSRTKATTKRMLTYRDVELDAVQGLPWCTVFAFLVDFRLSPQQHPHA
jgi:hypothetical protein